MRLLACEFRLDVDCQQLLALLDSRVQHAAQRYPVSRRHQLEVCRTDGGYRVCENGQDGYLQGTAHAVANTLLWRMNELALDALAEFTRIHAGCASWGGKRFLAAGAPQAGKSTLVTCLLYEGFAVHSDDMVLLRGNEVLPYPRRFGIRPPTVELIPQLARLAAGRSWGLALDPSELGFDWRIEPAPVDAVFFLEPNHGGATRLDACPKYVMAERVMSQSSLPAGGARSWIGDVCTMLERADCHVLRFGELGAAVAVIKDALRGPAASA